MTITSRARELWIFGLLTLIWGTTWAAIRVSLQGIPPFAGVALRFALAAVVLFALAPAFGIRFGRSRREVSLWVANALLTFVGSYGTVYWAEQWVPSGLASVIFATFPLFVVVLAFFALPAERLQLAGAAGVLIGFGGVAVIYGEDFGKLGGPQVFVAAVVLLVAPFVSALGNIVLKKWGSGIHPFSLTAPPMAIAAVLMGAASFFVEPQAAWSWHWAPWLAMVYLAIVGSALTFTLYYWLMERTSATEVSLLGFSIPVVAVLVGWLSFDEPITARTLLGSGLVLVGVTLAAWRTPKRSSDAT